MKGIVHGIRYCSWFMIFLSLTQAVPVSRNARAFPDGQIPKPPIKNNQVCIYENEIYTSGQTHPTANPCETCTCQPPGFTCSLKTCEAKPGCKALHTAGQCCPDYVCDCHRNGRTYGNGEKVEEPNPCNVCYCRGGEIQCAGVTCYTRADCEPQFVPGKCCPKYDHCPAIETPNRTPLARFSTEAPTPGATKPEPTTGATAVTTESTTETERTQELAPVKIEEVSTTSTDLNGTATGFPILLTSSRFEKVVEDIPMPTQEIPSSGTLEVVEIYPEQNSGVLEIETRIFPLNTTIEGANDTVALVDATVQELIRTTESTEVEEIENGRFPFNTTTEGAYDTVAEENATDPSTTHVLLMAAEMKVAVDSSSSHKEDSTTENTEFPGRLISGDVNVTNYSSLDELEMTSNGTSEEIVIESTAVDVNSTVSFSETDTNGTDNKAIDERMWCNETIGDANCLNITNESVDLSNVSEESNNTAEKDVLQRANVGNDSEDKLSTEGLGFHQTTEVIEGVTHDSPQITENYYSEENVAEVISSVGLFNYSTVTDSGVVDVTSVNSSQILNYNETMEDDIDSVEITDYIVAFGPNRMLNPSDFEIESDVVAMIAANDSNEDSFAVNGTSLNSNSDALESDSHIAEGVIKEVALAAPPNLTRLLQEEYEGGKFNSSEFLEEIFNITSSLPSYEQYTEHLDDYTTSTVEEVSDGHEVSEGHGYPNNTNEATEVIESLETQERNASTSDFEDQGAFSPTEDTVTVRVTDESVYDTVKIKPERLTDKSMPFTVTIMTERSVDVLGEEYITTVWPEGDKMATVETDLSTDKQGVGTVPTFFDRHYILREDMGRLDGVIEGSSYKAITEEVIIKDGLDHLKEDIDTIGSLYNNAGELVETINHDNKNNNQDTTTEVSTALEKYSEITEVSTDIPHNSSGSSTTENHVIKIAQKEHSRPRSMTVSEAPDSRNTSSSEDMVLSNYTLGYFEITSVELFTNPVNSSIDRTGQIKDLKPDDIDIFSTTSMPESDKTTSEIPIATILFTTVSPLSNTSNYDIVDNITTALENDYSDREYTLSDVAGIYSKGKTPEKMLSDDTNSTIDSATELSSTTNKDSALRRVDDTTIALAEILLKWLESKKVRAEEEKRSYHTKEEFQSNNSFAAKEARLDDVLTTLTAELIKLVSETTEFIKENKPEEVPTEAKNATVASREGTIRSLEMEPEKSINFVVPHTVNESLLMADGIDIYNKDIENLAEALGKPSDFHDNNFNEDSEIPIHLKYPFTDESLAPVLSMISDQLPFLKLGEEQPIYIEQPSDEVDDLPSQKHGVVVVPTSAPITVHMVKVVDGVRAVSNTEESMPDNFGVPAANKPESEVESTKR